MYYHNTPGGDEDILEDRDLNQVVNEEDQQKVVNNDPQEDTVKTEENKTEEVDSKKSLNDSKPV